MIDICGVPVSLMLVVNGTKVGLGTADDGEDNTDYGKKDEPMSRFALDRISTEVIESKALITAISKGIAENQPMVRAQKGGELHSARACRLQSGSARPAGGDIRVPHHADSAVIAEEGRQRFC